MICWSLIIWIGGLLFEERRTLNASLITNKQEIIEAFMQLPQFKSEALEEWQKKCLDVVLSQDYLWGTKPKSWWVNIFEKFHFPLK